MAVTRRSRRNVASSSAEQAPTGGSGHERRPDHPRHPDLLDREVERDRHALVHPVGRLVAVDLARHAHEVADARVLDRDALGPPGGSRGVDDVGEIGRVTGRPGLEAGVLGADERGGRLVQAHDARAGARHALAQVGEGDHGRRGGVVDDVLDPVVGEPGVERDVGRPQLQHRQHRGVGADGVVEEQRHAVSRAACRRASR